MKIFIALFSLGLGGLASAHAGDSGTASFAPTGSPNPYGGVVSSAIPGAVTYIPFGSSLRSPSPLAREGIDSLGGFDGTEPPPGVIGGPFLFPDHGSSGKTPLPAVATPLKGGVRP